VTRAHARRQVIEFLRGHGYHGGNLKVGFGCIVASEIEAPNMLANLV
jgi:hypothetical protein